MGRASATPSRLPSIRTATLLVAILAHSFLSGLGSYLLSVRPFCSPNIRHAMCRLAPHKNKEERPVHPSGPHDT